jgi:hypothetical protein
MSPCYSKRSAGIIRQLQAQEAVYYRYELSLLISKPGEYRAFGP